MCNFFFTYYIGCLIFYKIFCDSDAFCPSKSCETIFCHFERGFEGFDKSISVVFGFVKTHQKIYISTHVKMSLGAVSHPCVSSALCWELIYLQISCFANFSSSFLVFEYFRMRLIRLNGWWGCNLIYFLNFPEKT